MPSLVDPGESGVLVAPSVRPSADPPATASADPNVAPATSAASAANGAVEGAIPDKAAVLGEVRRLGFGCAIVALFVGALVAILLATCRVS